MEPLYPIAKICASCKLEKPLSEYSQRKDGRFEARCKECIRAADRLRHNTDIHRAKRRDHNKPKIETRRAQKLLDKQNTPPPPSVTHKLCPACDPPIIKPVGEFGKSKRNRDGCTSYCKACTQKKAHARLDKRREYNRQRLLDPSYKRTIRNGLNEWRRANPMHQRELTLRRNARKKAATTEIVDFKQILERDGFHCYICNQGILPHQKLEFDHVIPLIPLLGEPQGTHSADNIKPSHQTCNRRKANKQLSNLTEWDRRGPEQNTKDAIQE